MTPAERLPSIVALPSRPDICVHCGHPAQYTFRRAKAGSQRDFRLCSMCSGPYRSTSQFIQIS
jgi:hypothetical protein